MEILMPTRNPDLSKRVTNAIRDTFTDWGCIALESVIKGRISHSEADSALMMLRDCVLDKGGDLMSKNRMVQYLKNRSIPNESIDLTYYRDEFTS